MNSRVDLFEILVVFDDRESTVPHFHQSNLKLLELESLRRPNQLKVESNPSDPSGSSGSSQIPVQTDSECLWGSGNPSSCRFAFSFFYSSTLHHAFLHSQSPFSLHSLTCSPNSPLQSPPNERLPSLPSSGRKVRPFRSKQLSPKSTNPNHSFIHSINPAIINVKIDCPSPCLQQTHQIPSFPCLQGALGLKIGIYLSIFALCFCTIHSQIHTRFRISCSFRWQ